ncbi:glycosyltransferase [Tessaracoccus sp. G1721]
MVMITHLAPIPQADNAGQNFVTAQVQAWSNSWHVECIMLPGRSAREDLDAALTPCTIIEWPSPSGRAWLPRMVGRIRRWFPSLPDPNLTAALMRDERSRQLLRSADVVVLQWEDVAAQARTIKRINPEAVTVAVLHDVMSQSHERYARHWPEARQRWRQWVAARVSRLVERHIARQADRILVLSRKDAELLPVSSRHKVRVVPPPVVVPAEPRRRPKPGKIVLVSSWRQENIHGLSWFATYVLPIVRESVADLTIDLVGSNLTGERARSLEQQGFTVRGFVDDLDAVYSEAALTVVPLWLGAGVKFKVVEALLHAVPLVTTTVGAEGIDALNGRANVTDDAQSFAVQMIRALTSPAEAEVESAALRQEVLRDFHPDTIAAALDAVLE